MDAKGLACFKAYDIRGRVPQDLNLELLNAAGQVVWKESRPGSNGNVRIPLDLSNLDKGVYLLRMHAADKVTTQRVVKR